MSDDNDPVYSLDDVCEKLDKIEAALKDNHSDHGWVGLLIFGWLVIFVWLPDMWWIKTRISLWYSVAYDQVTIEKQPKDCNFFHAPLGGKDCHYDPHVSIVKVDNSNLWGGQSISYDNGENWIHKSKSQNGDAIVSTDGGKSWSPDFVPPFTKPGVVVTWEKKDDD
jgi:hypothetical protein